MIHGFYYVLNVSMNSSRNTIPTCYTRNIAGSWHHFKI